MARLLILGLVSLLLVACSDTAVEEKKAGNHEEAIKEEVANKKTPEQYIEEFKDAVNYDELVAKNENSELYPVDVDGDSIPEMVLIENKDIYNAYVTTFKLTNEEWGEVSKEAYSSITYIQLYFIDTLKYEDSSKAAFVVKVEEAGANNMYNGLNVFMYDEVEQKVKQTVRFQIEPTESEKGLVQENHMSFIDIEGNQINYEFQDGQLIDSDGKRFGAIIDDELAQLIGTTVNNYYLSPNDTYEEAIEKISETPELKKDVEADCAFYDSFYICDGTNVLTDFYITPLNDVTVEQLKPYFEEPIMLSDIGDYWEGVITVYDEYSTPVSMYVMKFDAASQKLTEMLVSFPTEAPTEY